MSGTNHLSMPGNVITGVRDSLDQAAADANRLGERVGDAAADAGAALRDAAHVAGAAAAQAGHDVYVRGQRAGQGIAGQVEKQPVLSLLAAAAAGLFAGLLLARR